MRISGSPDRHRRAATALSWWLDDERPAEVQTPTTSSHRVGPNCSKTIAGDLWDSGRTESSNTCHIVYGGRPLTSRQRVWWKVRAFDSDGIGSPWSRATYFEMGLLDNRRLARALDRRCADGRQTHAGAGARRCGVRSTCRNRSKARGSTSPRSASTTSRSTACARIDVELAPGWTDFYKRVRYQTFDVTRLLKRGENVIGVLLGDGWYCGTLGLSDRQQYGDRPLLLAQLEITLADGIADARRDRRSVEVASVADPVFGHDDRRKRRRATDARRVEQRQATTRRGWSQVDVLPSRHDISLDANASPPIRVIERIAPTSGSESPSGRLRRASSDLRLRAEHRRARSHQGARGARHADPDPSCRATRRSRRVVHREPAQSGRDRLVYVLGRSRWRSVRAALHVSRFPVRRDQRTFRRVGDRRCDRHRARVGAAGDRRFRVRPSVAESTAEQHPVESARQLRRSTDRLPATRRTTRLDGRRTGVRAHGRVQSRRRRVFREVAGRSDRRAVRQRNRSAARTGAAAAADHARRRRARVGRRNRDLSVDDLPLLRRQARARAPLRRDEGVRRQHRVALSVADSRRRRKSKRGRGSATGSRPTAPAPATRDSATRRRI